MIRVEADEDATVLQRGIQLANRFNMYCEDNMVQMLDAQYFVASFLLNLLHHREKIQQNQLDHILPKEVKDAWYQLLKILEDRDRTLVNVQQGSILLTLFCPSPSAFQQIQNDEWIDSIRKYLNQLLNTIGK